MNAKELREVLDKIDNSEERYKTFLKEEVYLSASIFEIRDLFKDYLTDEQKIQFMKTPAFKSYPDKYRFFSVFQDENIAVDMLLEDSFHDEISLKIPEIMSSLSSDAVLRIVKNNSFVNSHVTLKVTLTKYLKELEQDKLFSFLNNEDSFDEVFPYDEKTNSIRLLKLTELVSAVDSVSKKDILINKYNLKGNNLANVLLSFPTDTKRELILDNRYNLGIDEIQLLVGKLDVDDMVSFVRENKEYLDSIGFQYYHLTKYGKTEEEFTKILQNMDEMGLSTFEKRKVLLSLDNRIKESINMMEYFSPGEVTNEEIKALQVSVHVSDTSFFDNDLSYYKGMDDLFFIEPIGYSNEEKEKLKKFCEICPGAKIFDSLGISYSKGKEYIEAEKWIDSTIEKIPKDWPDIYKVAFVEHAIGNRISYTPEYETEVFSEKDCRPLWKIVSNGYGVCNGISQLEWYMLKQLGIDCDMVSSMTHAFVKLNNIEIPNSDGTLTKGDTISDPTWDLSSNRYGFMPGLFCISYETARSKDICKSRDRECHKNDEELSNVTMQMDKEVLRKIYKEIGVITREDGKFPFADTACKIDDELKINSPKNSKDKINTVLKIFENDYPDFSMHQFETITALSMLFSSINSLNFKESALDVIYNRDDQEKKPVVYIYMDLPDSGKVFYYADKEQKAFVELTEEQFTNKFECYQMKIDKNLGRRPWEKIQKAPIKEKNRDNKEIE